MVDFLLFGFLAFLLLDVGLVTLGVMRCEKHLKQISEDLRIFVNVRLRDK